MATIPPVTVTIDARQLAAAQNLYRVLSLMPCICKFASYGGPLVRMCQRCQAMKLWESSSTIQPTKGDSQS